MSKAQLKLGITQKWARTEAGDMRAEVWGSDVHCVTLLVQSLDSPASPLRRANAHSDAARYIWWCHDRDEGTGEGNEVGSEREGMLAAEECARIILRLACETLERAS